MKSKEKFLLKGPLEPLGYLLKFQPVRIPKFL